MHEFRKLLAVDGSIVGNGIKDNDFSFYIVRQDSPQVGHERIGSVPADDIPLLLGCDGFFIQSSVSDADGQDVFLGNNGSLEQGLFEGVDGCTVGAGSFGEQY